MDLGSITLLEVSQSVHGSQVAYCLTRGEFLFVTEETPRYFRSSTAINLFGKNLRQFLVPYDLEKLQDYIRAHCPDGFVSNDVSSKMTMMVRLVGTGESLWIRLKTVPLSLRLLRCIDSVTVLAHLKHHFADTSCFVVSDQELATIFNLPARQPSPPLQSAEYFQPDGSALTIAIPGRYQPPLELKTAPSPSEDSMMSTSPASPTGMLDALDDSLSSLAFEADWASETENPVTSGHASHAPRFG